MGPDRTRQKNLRQTGTQPGPGELYGSGRQFRCSCYARPQEQVDGSDPESQGRRGPHRGRPVSAQCGDQLARSSSTWHREPSSGSTAKRASASSARTAEALTSSCTTPRSTPAASAASTRGGSWKNAADIKMAVDAIELAFARGFITTFAIGTGDSDFTPLVHKLRELDKRVIGIGVQSSTSALLPPACDEFLFYDRLPGVEAVPAARRGRGRSRPQAAVTPDPVTDPVTAPVPAPAEEPAPADEDSDPGPLITRTLAGLQRHADGPVLASRLKRAVLRKDPTFDEAAHGFRAFGELLRHLESEHVLQLSAGSAQGDPEVTFPEDGSADDDAFGLLVDVVRQLQASGSRPQLSGLKDQLRKRRPDFSEERYGFNTFLSFAKAARARNLIGMNWDEDT